MARRLSRAHQRASAPQASRSRHAPATGRGAGRAIACIYCGCTEYDACVTDRGTCAWLSSSPAVCDAPACAAALKERRRFERVLKKGRSPVHARTLEFLRHELREAEAAARSCYAAGGKVPSYGYRRMHTRFRVRAARLREVVQFLNRDPRKVSR